MHVQQIQIVQLRHFSHASRQCQIIWRIVEQRITRHFHFVVVNVRLLAAQPNRLGIRDEMNLVAALGKFQTEFRGHHAAAAVGGITSNPNFHSANLALP